MDDSKETHQQLSGDKKKRRENRWSLCRLEGKKTYIMSKFRRRKEFCVCVEPQTCFATQANAAHAMDTQTRWKIKMTKY